MLGSNPVELYRDSDDRELGGRLDTNWTQDKNIIKTKLTSNISNYFNDESNNVTKFRRFSFAIIT